MTQEVIKRCYIFLSETHYLAMIRKESENGINLLDLTGLWGQKLFQCCYSGVALSKSYSTPRFPHSKKGECPSLM